MGRQEEPEAQTADNASLASEAFREAIGIFPGLRYAAAFGGLSEGSSPRVVADCTAEEMGLIMGDLYRLAELETTEWRSEFFSSVGIR